MTNMHWIVVANGSAAAFDRRGRDDDELRLHLERELRQRLAEPAVQTR